MNDPNRCTKCGGPLPVAGALSGRCPRCLLEVGLDSAVETEHSAAMDFLPSTIARYRVTRLIGQGGMGAVYEAEQEQPRRTVALKIIKPGMASPELLRRFEQETQALGRLQHPGIAQIYEAGTADTGFGPQPYFAMEFIRGRSLVKYAAEQKLDTRARLEIMAKVCDAVHHAHQRGLIHRDLKPGNILVDENGQPKIVDFGVARLTEHDTQAATQSGAGHLIGTLAYMSPEQVLADPLEIDTRSDVYALGVILYELLAGRLPYDTSSKLHEALFAIREEDPARLSSVDHGYRGDIETIVAKALEKEKTRRYASAAELAADIRRYLTDDPIMARPPSVGYQLQKFTRRHKALVAGVAAVFVVLVAGIVVSTWEAARAGQERDRAVQAEEKTHTERDRATAAEHTANTERDRAVAAETLAQRERDTAVTERERADTESETAKALNDFLSKDLLAMASPFAQFDTTAPGQSRQPAAPNPNMTMREALDRAAARIAGKFDKKPLVEAAVRETMASAYGSVYELAEAQKQLERVVQLRQTTQGSRHPDTLRARSSLSSALIDRGKYLEAAGQLKTVLKERSFGTPDHSATVRAIVSAYDQGYFFSDSEAFLLLLLEEDRRRGAWIDAGASTHISLLVDLYKRWLPRPKYAEAEALLKRVLVQLRRTRGADDSAEPGNVNLLAGVYIAQNKFREAEDLLNPLLPDALVAKVVAGGPPALKQYPTILSSMGLLVEVYGKQGKPAQADVLLGNVTKLVGTLPITGPGGENLATPLGSMALMASHYVQVGRDAEADELIHKVLEGFRRVIGQKDLPTQAVRSSLLSLSSLYVSQGKHSRAQRLLREILDIHLSTLSDEDVANALEGAAEQVEMFTRHGAVDSFEENELLLERLFRIQRRVLGESGPFRGAMWSLSQVYWDHAKFDLARGRMQQAQRGYEKADELIAELVKLYRNAAGGAQQARTLISMSRLAQVRASLGRYDEAETLFTEVLGYRRVDPNEALALSIVLSELGWVRVHQRKFFEAEAVLREGCGRFEAGGEQRFNCDSILGASLVGQRRFPEAEPLLLAGYAGLTQPPDERPTTSTGSQLVTARFYPQDAGAWIVRMYEEWGKPEQAAEWRKRLQANNAATTEHAQ